MKVMLKNKKEYDEKEELKRLLKKKRLLYEYQYKDSKEKELKWFTLLASTTLYPLITQVFAKAEKLYPDFFQPLKDALIQAEIKIPYKIYIGSIFAISTAISSILLGVLFGLYAASKMSLLTLISGIILSLLLPLSVILLIGYITPFYIINEKKKHIDNNLPFILNHLYAISHASVPLDRAFRMLRQLGDYGALSKEIDRIIKRMDVFGEDVITAMKYVATTTPSENFKSILFGIMSIIESGGNLREYLSEMSQLALFNYRLERKKYVETLSTYADIYTAILITAPLFLVATLSIINIVPDSKIMGYDPIVIMKAGTYFILPFINLIFLIFLTLTQPEI